MSGEPEDLDMLAAEYVLGSLPGEQRAAFERQIEQDPRIKAAVARWADRLSPLAGALDQQPVPETVWRRIDAAIRPAVRSAGARRASQGWRTFIGPRNRTLVWGGLGALAAALVLAVMLVNPMRSTISPPDQVLARAEFPGEAGAPRYRVLVAADRASVYVSPEGPPPPRGRAHELWVLEPGGKPHTLGLLDPERPILLATPSAAEPFLAEGAIIAISLEPEGGSPLDRPSGPVLIASTLAAA